MKEIEIPKEMQPHFEAGGPLRLRRGKVRDIIESKDHLVIVATDRISAFDVVMPTEVLARGYALFDMSLFWFGFFDDIPNHLGFTGSSGEPRRCNDPMIKLVWETMHSQLFGRAMTVRKADPLPVEFIVRGYAAGSYWREYKRRLVQCDSLCEGPIFTPSTKAENGKHDENIDSETACNICCGHLGWTAAATRVLMKTLTDWSLSMYKRAHSRAIGRGIIIADTKFEFGMIDGRPVLIDEVLTPDSSRFWSLADYDVGRDQPSYDKEILRDYLIKIGWGPKPTEPPPELPAELVDRIRDRYQEIKDRLL